MSKNNKIFPYCISMLGVFAMVPVNAAETNLNTQNLDDIVVTATKSATRLKDAPASVTLITREDLQQKPVENLLDAVRETTGISMSGRGVGGRGVINIRGMESHQTLILLDGKRTSATDNVLGHSNFQYNQIPIEAIERIEIVRGPLSALYGSEALGGVINIITRAVPDKWSRSLRVQGGIREGGVGGNEGSVGIYAAGPLGENAGLTISGSYLNQERTDLEEDDRISELEGQEVAEILAKLTVTPWEGHRFEAEIASSNEDRVQDTNSRGGAPYYESQYELDRDHYALGYDGSFGSTNVHVNYYQSTFEQINSRNNGVTPTVPQELKDEILDGYVSLPLFNNQMLTFGGEYRVESLIHEAISGGETDIKHTALFVQDEIEILDNLLLTVGVRADDHEQFGVEYSPRAYLVYHLNNEWSFKGGYGHGFKAPTIKQVAPEYQFRGFHSFVGNADVGPETSDNLEIGAIWENENYRFGMTAFHNKVDDLITTSCIVNCNITFGRVYEYINIDEAKTQGLESEAKLKFSNGLSLNFNHTYLDAEDETTGLSLANRPEHKANASLNWSLEQWDLNTAVRAEYTGSQVDYATSGAVIDIPSYTLWHLNFSKKMSSNFTLRGGVENLSNVRLIEESDDYGYEERGRFYYLGFNAEF